MLQNGLPDESRDRWWALASMVINIFSRRVLLHGIDYFKFDSCFERLACNADTLFFTS
jgi:hypothetical protein